MSLGWVAVECNDSKFYLDPVWRGSDFFVCFDEDEPPEIVIRASNETKLNTLEVASEILRLLGFRGVTIDLTSFQAYLGRSFKKPGTQKVKTYPAYRYFFKVGEPPPVPHEHLGVGDTLESAFHKR